MSARVEGWALFKKGIFFKGFITGMLLQLAIGPVFVFIINITLQNGLLNGLAAVAAVTVVDYLYIVMSIIGIGALLEKPGLKKIMLVVSSIVLIVFGVLLVNKGINFVLKETSVIVLESYFKSFATVFILTISSPLTIVFWTGLFGNKAIEYKLDKKGLLVFGAAAGLATAVFMGTSVIVLSTIKVVLPLLVFKVLNIFAGLVLISFGIMRLVPSKIKNSVNPDLSPDIDM
ncbi:MAG: LysE family transporter [Spirochaetes bacterium]|nr:LysE family transporter [Spirochaetota bacterium]